MAQYRYKITGKFSLKILERGTPTLITEKPVVQVQSRAGVHKDFPRKKVTLPGISASLIQEVVKEAVNQEAEQIAEKIEAMIPPIPEDLVLVEETIQADISKGEAAIAPTPEPTPITPSADEIFPGDKILVDLYGNHVIGKVFSTLEKERMIGIILETGEPVILEASKFIKKI